MEAATMQASTTVYALRAITPSSRAEQACLARGMAIPPGFLNFPE